MIIIINIIIILNTTVYGIVYTIFLSINIIIIWSLLSSAILSDETALI